MSVEHVHVHEGGQAIVCNVEGARKSMDRSHEPCTVDRGAIGEYARRSSMSGQDPQGHALPAARD